MALGSDVDAGVADAEVLVDDDAVGDGAQGVALAVGGQCVEGVGHFHVAVERVVFRHGALLAVRVVYR